MTNPKQNNRFGYNDRIEQTGVLLETEILEDDKIRFVVQNAGGSNEITISAKLKGQSNYVPLKTLTGTTEDLVTVDTYELIKIECTTLDGNNVILLGSGFRNEC